MDSLDAILADKNSFTPEAQALMEKEKNNAPPQPEPANPEPTPNPEPNPEPANPEPTAPVLDDNHYLESFNKRFGTTYQNFDEIKNNFKTPDYEIKNQERESSLTSKEKELEEMKEILAQYNDPLKYFNGNEKLYKLVQLQAKYPELNSKVLEASLNGLDKVSNLQKAIFGEQLDIPEADEMMAKELLADALKCEVDDLKEENLGNLTSLQKALLTKKANEATKNLSKYREEIQAPQKFDPEAIKQSKVQAETKRLEQIDNSWKPVLQTLNTDKAIEAFEELQKDGKVEKVLLHKMEMDDDFMKSIPEKFLQIARVANMPANEKNYHLIYSRLKSDYFYEHRNQIIKQAQTDAVTKFQEVEYEKNTHPSGKKPEPRVTIVNDDKAKLSKAAAKAFGFDD